MSTLVPNTAAIDARTNDIAAQIRAAMSPVTDADELRNAAKSEFSDASEGAVNARELVMQSLALASMQGKWTEVEVDRAIKITIATSNAETPKSIQTFMGETKRAMHPNVRVRFAGLVAVRNAVWSAETQARDSAKATKTEAHTPVMHAFKRSYHALAELMKEAEKGVVHTETSFVTFAESRNPDFNVATQAKIIKSAMEALGVICGRFPDSDLAAAVDFLGKVTKETLAAARGSIHGDAVPTTVAGSTTVVATTSSASQIMNDVSGEVASGASDILDDVLGIAA